MAMGIPPLLHALPARADHATLRFRVQGRSPPVAGAPTAPPPRD